MDQQQLRKLAQQLQVLAIPTTPAGPFDLLLGRCRPKRARLP
ncbi:hypothetical protein OHA79_42460 [Streptomyces sp. NBC_00841]|nr:MULTISPECIES: hypothetical protein [unclassified Streptomyces]MCX4530339.1 hypothetical protein [Streptomyces sp. NBC_01669]WSA03888.1 hypothetical protein OHA79_42460 [Streptomyces sp. NBC_00841]